MRNRLTVIFVITLLVIGVSANLSAAKEVVSETVKVYVTIPSIQKLEVIDNVVINDLSSQFKNRDNGQPVVIENAGAVRVMSNDNWRLEFYNTASTSSYNVFVRVDDGSGWQNISQKAGSVSGDHGSLLLNFDLKIEPTADDVSNINGGVELGFTIDSYKL